MPILFWHNLLLVPFVWAQHFPWPNVLSPPLFKGVVQSFPVFLTWQRNRNIGVGAKDLRTRPEKNDEKKTNRSKALIF